MYLGLCMSKSSQGRNKKVANASAVAGQQAEALKRLQNFAADAGTVGSLLGWTAPTLAGAAIGGITAPRKKVLKGALRGAGVGAALHAGTSLGARAGNALGGDSPMTGGLVGGAGGGIASALLANRLLPAVDDDEEKTAQNVFHAFGAKIAASSYSSCHMPNGPTNKKHMTSASPAVLEADDQSEEIGQPPKTETEHSKDVVTGKIARSNNAYAAGRDIAKLFNKTGFELSRQPKSTSRLPSLQTDDSDQK
jgi:hypothetical protein